jgi:hypothetical protein
MSLLRPDPTFYPSPRMAMHASPEKLAYVALINSDWRAHAVVLHRDDNCSVARVSQSRSRNPSGCLVRHGPYVGCRAADHRSGDSLGLVVEKRGQGAEPHHRPPFPFTTIIKLVADGHPWVQVIVTSPALTER